MKVPMLDPAKYNLDMQDELIQSVEDVIRSGKYINSRYVPKFERACVDFLGCHGAVGVSSGTDALLASLMAFRIQPGDKVACPTFTFFATAGAIARLGAEPVFMDVDKDTFNSPIEEYERVLSIPGVKAVIPVHLFGQPADMPAICNLARSKGVCVIEDVAQAFGSEVGGRKCGAWGDLGCFSFFPSKNLGGFGDGGLISCGSSSLVSNIVSLRNHGMSNVQYQHTRVGGNFRLDELQAALLLAKLSRIDQALAERRRHAVIYKGSLSDTRFILPSQGEGGTYNQFTLRIPGGKRDALASYLEKKGIGSAIYYPIPLHKQPCFSYDGPELENSMALSREVLSIPIAPELSIGQIEFVARALIDFDRTEI